MPRYCHECGEPIKEGNGFCENCGNKFYDQGIPGAGMGVVQKKHCGFGIAALVLGIVSMCLIWVTLFPRGLGFWFYLIVELPMAIIATSMGAFGFWGKWKDKFGLAGFILGLLVIILGLVFSVIIWMIL